MLEVSSSHRLASPESYGCWVPLPPGGTRFRPQTHRPIMFVVDFIRGLALEFAERLDYSIRMMSLEQWGIVSGIALVAGIGMMRYKRLSL